MTGPDGASTAIDPGPLTLMGHTITGPEIAWVAVIIGTVLALAGVTAYLLVALAFIREHRRRATAVWQRANAELDEVMKARRQYINLTLTNEAKTARITTEKAAFVRRYMDGLVTPEQARADAEEYIFGDGHRKASPEGLHAIINPIPEFTECIDPDCEWAHLPHTIAMHKTLVPREQERCTEPTCPVKCRHTRGERSTVWACPFVPSEEDPKEGP